MCDVCVCVVGGAEGVLSSEELATELGRQRRLYDELLDKTQQIQSVRNISTSLGLSLYACSCIVSVRIFTLDLFLLQMVDEVTSARLVYIYVLYRQYCIW